MASDPIRLAVVVIAILSLIVLITKFRIHPFIALILASWFLGIACGLPPTEVIKHFEKGFGDVLSFVGIVIGLGAMLGGILISSGGADVLANDLIALGGKKWIPWTMFLASLLIGLPLFFEVGFVLLVPLAFVISKRMDTPILRVGLPMLAGLSVAHALVPPHPAPTLDAKSCATLMPQILEKAGQLDILHANAGIYVGGDLVDANTDAIDRMLNLNVCG
jgi:gluconate:H+ symporter, GntP family